MCQLNLYIVPKSVNKENVLNLMRDYFYFERPQCVTEENILIEVQDEHEIYVSAGMGCNCGTVQSIFKEEDAMKSWSELKQEKINEKREHLLKIKKFLEREDYLEIKTEIRNRLDEFEKIRETANGEDVEDTLYEMQRIFQEGVYFDSMRYEKHKMEDGTEVSFKNIDEDLENVERSVSENVETEFKNLKTFVDEILKETDEVKLFSFWQSANVPKIEGEKYVFQDELKIEDIIYMKYNELITIFKR